MTEITNNLFGMPTRFSYPGSVVVENTFQKEMEAADTRITEEQKMAQFKKEFWAEVASIPKTPTIDNLVINVTEEGWKRMQEEPEYREKMMALIRRDTMGHFCRQVDSVITIGGTAEEYLAHSQGSLYSNFNRHMNENSYRERKEKRKRYMQEIFEKMREKRLFEKKKWQELEMKVSRIGGFYE